MAGGEETELNCQQEAEELLWTYYVAYENRSVLSLPSRNPGLYHHDSEDEVERKIHVSWRARGVLCGDEAL